MFVVLEWGPHDRQPLKGCACFKEEHFAFALGLIEGCAAAGPVWPCSLEFG